VGIPRGKMSNMHKAVLSKNRGLHHTHESKGFHTKTKQVALLFHDSKGVYYW